MGRKQKKLWEHFLFFPATCLTILLAIIGCQQTVESPDFPVVQGQMDELYVTRLNQDTTAELAQLEAQLLDQAEASLTNGGGVEALQSVAKAMSCCEGLFVDRAFDLIETALTHPDIELANFDNAVRCLRRVEAHFSIHGYGPATGCWITVLGDMLVTVNENQRLSKTVRFQKRKIQTLIEQIEQLKAVDLEPVQPETADEIP